MRLGQQRIAIVGGGVAGLSLAGLLRESGAEVTIYERTPGPSHLGGGIILAPNSVRALERLGLAHLAGVHGVPLDRMIIFDHAGGELYRREQADVAHQYGGKGLLGVRRSELHRALFENVPKTWLRFGQELTELKNDFGGATLGFKNGERVHAELVVGADGTHSRTRELLFPSVHLKPTGDVTYRGISTNIPTGKLENAFAEFWGPGRRFSFFRMSETHVYWHASLQQGEDERRSHADLLQALKDFPAVVHEVLLGTPPTHVVSRLLTDTDPVTHWWNRRVVLVGDAAHATSPNLGQGAAQAMEDAISLADHLTAERDFIAAMSRYQASREATANAAVNNSRNFGEMGRRRGLGRIVRNVAIGINPELARRRIEAFYGEHHQ